MKNNNQISVIPEKCIESTNWRLQLTSWFVKNITEDFYTIKRVKFVKLFSSLITRYFSFVFRRWLLDKVWTMTCGTRWDSPGEHHLWNSKSTTSLPFEVSQWTILLWNILFSFVYFIITYLSTNQIIYLHKIGRKKS